MQDYCSSVGSDHRRKYGQFFTPAPVASFMCEWALAGGATELYDPAVGLGAFFSAAQQMGARTTLAGAEIDAVILEHFRDSQPTAQQAFVRKEDYLLNWGGQHEAIVCNPPYMRFQNFSGREAVFACFQNILGLRLSGYTNSASAFLLKSLSELPPGGRLAYIMPLEFLNAGYGSIVKSQLLQSGRLKALIRLESEREVFPDAITSVGIVLVANNQRVEPVNFYTLSDLGQLPKILSSRPANCLSSTGLNPSAKWLSYFETPSDLIDDRNLISIREYGDFSRGIATGANEFFVMSSSKARQLAIPSSALSRCIARSSQVKRC
ncbi:MAG: N-6 DNA methylase, partial [candidate division Zixibacteria bacterium]|nr:N-6 DNA methylase [candidate division Zixibacteria bacterium]